MERQGAVLGLLWLQVFWVTGSQVQQGPSVLSLQEGTSPTLRCNFSTTMRSVQWFQQNPGGSLISLFYIASASKEDGRLKSTFNSKESYTTLHIRALQLEDSGTYFCAAEAMDTNYQLIWGSGTKLIIKPDIQDPAPAVYQLRDPKSSKNSVCLFTDFDSQVNVSHLVDSEMFISDKTVLDMKSMDSKSNGALAWSNKTDFKCTDVFTENTFTASSDISCDANLVEKSFETDMNLNFQNLSVMGLRILLLKVAGFNLLMTLRLWSS